MSNRDIKAIKRQQRMIRNRESASLSRQRRKSYLESIEKRNNYLEDDNKQLQASNINLRKKISMLQEEIRRTQNNVPHACILNAKTITISNLC